MGVFSKLFACGGRSGGSKREKDYYVDTKRLHSACRSVNAATPVRYQNNVDAAKGEKEVLRPFIPDENVSWSVEWPEYNPVVYTSPKVLAKPVWADTDDVKSITNWNTIDTKIDRRSHIKKYEIDSDGYPLNPMGRTGIRERGQLGKWGPNHAADPIVTRWKLDDKGKKVKHPESGKPILQFVSIKRLDKNEWAIPGGMVDPGEKISVTLKREFMEEATNSIEQTEEGKKKIDDHLKKLFSNGTEIYRGYVDDPRNTDNAWMETIAYNFHDEKNEVFRTFKLTAGDDAGSVTWMDMDKDLHLYASHKDFITKVAKLHKAHW